MSGMSGARDKDKVMLLIDADNVSADVMEQAVHKVLAEHGALHVRRAYGTVDMALKHQALFRRLSIRPMVNLATGKNSTDIALAVDAMDLVVAERPQVVYLVSSDSDFAPLVGRLREKGCRVCGIGQQGKTGEETIAVYDAFTDLRHKGGEAAASPMSAPTPARSPSPAVAKKAAAARTPRARSAAAAVSPATAPASAASAEASPASVAASAPVSAPAPRRAPPRKAAAKTAAKTAGRKTPDRTAEAIAASEAAEFILQAVPALRSGGEVALNDIAQALRTSGLLGKNASSIKLFEKLPAEFVVLQHPDRIRWIGANAR